MYSAPHPVTSSMNGVGSGMIDDQGTINPAALNSPGMPSCHHQIFCVAMTANALFRDKQHALVPPPSLHPYNAPTLLADSLLVPAVPVLPAPTINNAYSAAPRGLKRSRSPPDVYSDALRGGQVDDGEFYPTQTQLIRRHNGTQVVVCALLKYTSRVQSLTEANCFP